jgi:hypothetical protein
VEEKQQAREPKEVIRHVDQLYLLATKREQNVKRAANQ